MKLQEAFKMPKFKGEDKVSFSFRGEKFEGVVAYAYKEYSNIKSKNNKISDRDIIRWEKDGDDILRSENKISIKSKNHHRSGDFIFSNFLYFIKDVKNVSENIDSVNFAAVLENKLRKI